MTEIITNPPKESAPETPTTNKPEVTAPGAKPLDLGEIRAGVSPSGKPGNAKEAIRRAQAAAVEQAQSLTAGAGQIMYIKPGYPVFNTATAKGLKIAFEGGRYLVDKSDPNLEDIVNALHIHVERGVLEAIDGDTEE